MRDLELAAETAAGVRASFEAIEHRRAVQEYWLEDWKHRGLTLDAASELVGAGKKNATWAKEWFKGYSAPYLDRTPPTSVKWPARAWGWLSGGDAPRRRAGKKYVARNVAPLAAATRRFWRAVSPSGGWWRGSRRRTRAGGRSRARRRTWRRSAFRGEDRVAARQQPRGRRGRPPRRPPDRRAAGARTRAPGGGAARGPRGVRVRGREPVRIRRERRRRSRSVGGGDRRERRRERFRKNKRAGPRRRGRAVPRVQKLPGQRGLDGHARRRRGRRVRVRDSAGGHGAARRGCGREGRLPGAAARHGAGLCRRAALGVPRRAHRRRALGASDGGGLGVRAVPRPAVARGAGRRSGRRAARTSPRRARSRARARRWRRAR